MKSIDAKEKPDINHISDALVEKGVDFEISVSHPNILHRMKILKTVRKFTIKPLHYGTIIRISGIIHNIDEVEKLNNYVTEGIESIHKNANKIVEVIAFAITDTKSEPSIFLKNFIKWNLTPIELQTLLNIIIKQMRIIEFLQSIILVKGLNQMENLNQSKMEVPQDTETVGKQSVQ